MCRRADKFLNATLTKVQRVKRKKKLFFQTYKRALRGGAGPAEFGKV